MTNAAERGEFLMSDQWRNVVEQEQRQREQRMAQDKYHPTQEVYHLEQNAAHEGQFHGEPVEAPPGLIAKIRQAIMKLFGRS
jgi:hypothetical protein